MKTLRLGKKQIKDLVKLSGESDFRVHLDSRTAGTYCNGDMLGHLFASPLWGYMQAYGVYDKDGMLVAVMTATFLKKFPMTEMQSGKVVVVGGSYTARGYRRKGLQKHLLKMTEKDARTWGAYYLVYPKWLETDYKWLVDREWLTDEQKEIRLGIWQRCKPTPYDGRTRLAVRYIGKRGGEQG